MKEKSSKKAGNRCGAYVLTGVFLVLAILFRLCGRVVNADQMEQKGITFPYTENTIYELPLDTDFLLGQSDGAWKNVHLSEEAPYETTCQLVCVSEGRTIRTEMHEGALNAVYGICTEGRILMAAVFEESAGGGSTSFFYIGEEPCVLLETEGIYTPAYPADREVLKLPNVGPIAVFRKVFGGQAGTIFSIETDRARWSMREMEVDGDAAFYEDGCIYYLRRPLLYIPEMQKEGNRLPERRDQCTYMNAGECIIVGGCIMERDGLWYEIGNEESGHIGWIRIEGDDLKLQNCSLQDIFTDSRPDLLFDSPHCAVPQPRDMQYEALFQDGNEQTTCRFQEEDGQQSEYYVTREEDGVNISFRTVDEILYGEEQDLSGEEECVPFQIRLPEGAKDLLLIRLDLDRTDGRMELALQYTVESERGEQTYSNLFYPFAGQLFSLTTILDFDNRALPVCFCEKQERIVDSGYEGQFAYRYDYRPVYIPEGDGTLQFVEDGVQKQYMLYKTGTMLVPVTE